MANFERSVYSQNGEDGVIEKIFEVIGTSSEYFVEFGAADGVWLSNTANLRLNKSWNGLLLEGNNEDLSINLHKEFITAENITEIFDKYNVPYDLDLFTGNIQKY